MKYKYPFSEANKKSLHRVFMVKYGNIPQVGSLLYEEVEIGHFEEFLNNKSTCVWFILDGSGTFVINDEKITVVKQDLIVVPPKNRIYYFGKMKMLLLNTPEWNAKDEEHIRDVDTSEIVDK